MVNKKSFNNYNNNSNELKETLYYNQYKNNLGINPNNKKQIKTPYKKEQKYLSAFDIMISNKKDKNEVMNNIQNLKNKENQIMPISSKPIMYSQKLNFKNSNFNEDTQSGSTFAYSKKFYSINNQNLTEDHNNKFRMGLLSAFSNSNNNNIIIPILPLQRPLSNFNLGVGQLWENIDNNINKNNINNNDKIESSNMNINTYKTLNEKNKNKDELKNKIGTGPNHKRNEYNNFSNINKEKNLLNKNYRSLFNSISSYGPKFHHIKIEKSLMNNKMKESLKRNILLNYMTLEQSHLPKIKNTNYNGLKKMRNNSSKN